MKNALLLSADTTLTTGREDVEVVEEEERSAAEAANTPKEMDFSSYLS